MAGIIGQIGVMGGPRGRPPERPYKAIGKRLVAVRHALGISSQAELCRTLGVLKSQWNQYETGERRITIDVALKLKMLYGITIDYIYTGDPSGLPARLHQQIAIQ